MFVQLYFGLKSIKQSIKSKVLSEAKAGIYISTAIDSSKNFNRSSLKRLKYNLIYLYFLMIMILKKTL